MYKMAQKDTNFPLVKVNLPEKDKTNSTVRIWQDPERKAHNGTVSNDSGLYILQLSDSCMLFYAKCNLWDILCNAEC